MAKGFGYMALRTVISLGNPVLGFFALCFPVVISACCCVAVRSCQHASHDASGAGVQARRIVGPTAKKRGATIYFVKRWTRTAYSCCLRRIALSVPVRAFLYSASWGKLLVAGGLPQSLRSSLVARSAGILWRGTRLISCTR